MLASCGGGEPAAPTEEARGRSNGDGETGTYTSAALDESHAGALPASSQLALGTLKLEDTENAVTPEQAGVLLPLWQALQGTSLQNDVERNAVLKQIEEQMTTAQLATIAAMRLTVDDQAAWMQEQGLNPSPPAIVSEAPQGGFGGNLSEDERAAMRATRQAMDGGQGGFGPLGEQSEDERASMRATAEAGGQIFPGRQGGASTGASLIRPLVALLTERATE